MILKIIIALLLAATTCLQAVPRMWLSVDGKRSMAGEFLQRDATSITIRNTEGKQVVIPLAKLHLEDRSWVDMNHPPGGAAPEKPPPTAVFDKLVFGETRDNVLTKLKASKFVELTIDQTFLGRSGINGVFRTRKKIGDLEASLYFDWNEADMLKELTLQTETLPASDYKSKLEPSWQGFIGLLTNLYGKPIQQGSFPSLETITDGAFVPSHLWPLEAGGSVLLGSARDGENYQIVVRFTQKKIQPTEYR